MRDIRLPGIAAMVVFAFAVFGLTSSGRAQAISADTDWTTHQTATPGAVYTIANGVTLTGTGVTYAGQGGAIYDSGAITFTGVGAKGLIFTNNDSGSFSGGAIYSGANLVINGTYGILRIDHNTASNTGGAIFTTGSAFISGKYDSILFDSNTASSHGGGIYAGRDIIISATANTLTFSNNRTDGLGGALSTAGGAITISGSYDKLIAQGNSALDSVGANYAGAFYAGNASSGIVSIIGDYGTGGILIDSNTASNAAASAVGGAINATKGIVITATTSGSLAITNNYSSVNAGAFYSVGNITIDGTYGNGGIIINSNTAKLYGGAVFINNASGTFAMSATSSGTLDMSYNMANNGAVARAGAISIDGAYAGLRMQGNRSAGANNNYFGAVFYTTSSNIWVGGSYGTGGILIDANIANSGGGAFYSARDIFVTATSAGKMHITNNAAMNGTGGAMGAINGSIFIDGTYGGLLVQSNTSAGSAAAASGGAFGASGTVTLAGQYGADGILISSNTTSNRGGAIYGGSGVFISATTKGSFEISKNIASSSGGALHSGKGVEITGSYGSITIDSNKSVATNTEGGAIHAAEGITIDARVAGNMEITNNTAGLQGGAFAAKSGDIKIRGNYGGDLLVTSNTSLGTNGAIWASGSVVIDTTTVGDLTLRNNYAATAGGALNASDTVGTGITIAGSYGGIVITSNTAKTTMGGALGTNSGILVNATSGSMNISNNFAASHGGAFYAGNGVIEINAASGTTVVASNKSNGSGGAFYSGNSFRLVTGANSVFTATNNTSSNNGTGGFLYANSGSLYFDIGANSLATIGGSNSASANADSIAAAAGVALIKEGSGTLTLWGNNSGLSGTTSVNNGALVLATPINASANSIGSGALNIGTNGAVYVAPGGGTPGNYAFTNVLTGSGLLDVDLLATSNTFVLTPARTAGFFGTANFHKAIYTLANDDFHNATLITSMGNLMHVGSGSNHVAAYVFNGGTTQFDVSNTGTYAAGWIDAGTLTINPGTSYVQIDKDNINILPTTPLLLQDDLSSGRKILAQGAVVTMSNGTLALVDLAGNLIDMSTVVSAAGIDQGTTYAGIAGASANGVTATGTYLGGGLGISSTDIYLSGGTLTVLNLLANKTTVLDNDATKTYGDGLIGNEMKAQIVGTGTLWVMDTGTGITLTGSNTNSGGIVINKGTLIAGNATNAAAALGTGAIFYNATSGSGSSLLFNASSTMTQRQVVTTNASGTLAAADGTTLTVTATQNQVNGSAVYVYGGGTFNNTGNISYQNNTATGDGGAIYVNTGGALNFSSGTISFENNKSQGGALTNGGGAIYATGLLVINGAGADAIVFKNNSANADTSTNGQGGAIRALQGVLFSDTAHPLSFIDNTASVGGAVRASGATDGITINGGVLLDRNIATTTVLGHGAGGALSTHAGDIKVSILAGDVTITRNIAVGSTGGALEAGNSGNVIVGNANGKVDIQHNYAGYNYDANRAPTSVNGIAAVGGAIYSGGSTTLNGTQITLSDNHANGSGGGIYAQRNVTINGAIISGSNSSVNGSGGAIYSVGNVTINATATSPTQFSNNTAKTQGGAIYTGNSFNLITADNSVFTATGNRAANLSSGGFLYVNSGSMLFNLGNSATATIGVDGDTSGADSISGGAKLVKNGQGTLLLNVENTYTGGSELIAGNVVMTNTQALGTGAAVFRNSGTLIVNTGSINFINNLSSQTAGAGLVIIDLDDSANRFAFNATGRTTVYSGTALFRKSFYTLANQDFARATVISSSGNLMVIDSGSNHVANFTFDSGTTRFDLAPNLADSDRAAGWIDTGTLTFGTGGAVQIDTALFSGGTLANSKPLLQQDDGLNGRQLINATDLADPANFANLRLIDLNGNAIPATSATSAIVQNSAITGNNGQTATGYYTTTLFTSGTVNGVAAQGLFVGAQLTQLDLIVGKTTVLTSDTNNPILGDEFHALISGSGNLWIDAANTITLNHTNTYSGVTFVNSGTLAFGADNAMGQTSMLNVRDGGAVLVTGSQTVGNATSAKNSRIDVVSGTLAGSGTGDWFLNGDVTVNNGIVTTNSAALNLANGAGMSGTMTLTGSAYVEAGSVYIARNGGTAGLTISDSSTFKTGGVETVFGYIGSANVLVKDSGTMITDSLTYIGRANNGRSVVTVTDNAVWQSKYISLGGDTGADGYLVVSGSGRIVSGAGANIGAGSSGSVTIKDSGFWDLQTNSFSIGGGTYGVLEILGSGSLITQGDAILGNASGGRGRLIISDTGLMQVTNLSGGNNGSGSVLVQDSGTLIVRGGATFGPWNGSSGTLTIRDNAYVDVTNNTNITRGLAQFDGGILKTKGLGGTASGTAIFNGGTLQAAAINTNFISGFATPGNLQISTGGAYIDSNGYNIGVAADNGFAGGAGDGGLTKLGSGTLTLNGTSSYTGNTNITTGALVLATATNDSTNVIGTGTLVLAQNTAAYVAPTGASSNYTFSNALSGSGLFDVNLVSASNTFAMNALTSGFTGTANFRKGVYTLANGDFHGAQVISSAGNRMVVGSGSNHVAGFTFNSGTVRFDLTGNATDPNRANGWIDTGTLNFGTAGTSYVQVDPSLISGGTLSTTPLLQQDDGTNGTQLINAQAITGNISNLRLVDLAGNTITGTTTSAIIQNLVTTATGYYQVNGLSTTGYAGSGTGLYVNTMLTRIDLVASTTTSLASDTVPPTDGDDFKAQITGSGNLAIDASNKITLKSGSNTYTGTTFVNSGTLAGGNTNVIASSTMLVIANSAVFDTGTFAQSVNNLSGSGTVIATNTLTLNQSQSTTYAGTLSSTAAIGIHANSSTLTLTGTSSNYSGAATLNSGGLVIDGVLGNAASTLTTSSNSWLSGTGTITGTAAVSGTLAPGMVGAPGMLTFGGLTLADSSRTVFDLATPNVWDNTNDRITVNGDVTIASGAALDLYGSNLQTSSASVYNLISYSGSLAYGGYRVDFGTTGLSPYSSYVDISVSGTVRIVNTGTDDNTDPTSPNAFTWWDGAAASHKNNGLADGGDGTWQAFYNATTGTWGENNWTRQAGDLNAPWKDAGYAIFSGSAGTVTVDNSVGQVAASGMQFRTDDYLITGGSVALAASTYNSGTFQFDTQNSGTVTVANDLFGQATLNAEKLGVGTLVLSGSNAYGDLTISNGKLLLEGYQQGAVVVNTATATLGGSGIINGTVTVNSGTITAGDLDTVGKLTVGSLDLAAASTARFDLRANEAAVSGTVFSGTNDWIASNSTVTAADGVTLSIGGTNLAVGLYHLISYTDAGSQAALQNTVWNLLADVSTGAAIDDLYVQTSVANQINLINTGTTPNNDPDTPDHLKNAFIWWDGPAIVSGTSTRNDQVVQGGSGTWEAWTGGNDNWTQQSGSLNAGWKQNGYAQFSGSAGTVTVSNGKGQVIASGMNFLTDGYVITGGTVQLGATTRGTALLSATSGVTGTIAVTLSDPSGTLTVAKDGLGTVAITSTNDYAGGTHVEQGALVLATSAATTSTTAIGSGTLTIDALATTQVTPGLVTSYTFANALAGQGLLDIDLGASSGTFAFDATASGTDFAGVVRLTNATYNIAPNTDNTLALANATLMTSSGAIVNLGQNTTAASGTQHIHGIAFNGGKVNVQMKDPTAAHLLEVDNLFVAHSVAHTTVFDLGINSIATGTNVTGNFLDQDNGDQGILLVKTTNLDLAGKQMILMLDGTTPIATSSTVNDNFGHNDVVATYNYMAVSATNNHLHEGPGVYAAYILTQLETNSGLVLTSSSAGDKTLGARITGSGFVEFIADDGSITLASGSNDYTGATSITTGTVIAASNNVLGHTSTLSLSASTAFDLSNYTQTVGVLDTASTSAIALGNTGSLAILNGGTSNGALVGGSLSTLDIAGALVVNGSNALDSTVNLSGTATLNHVAGLGATGTINIASYSDLEVGSSGTFTKTLAGQGEYTLLSSATIAVTGSNTAFSGTFKINDGAHLIAETNANLGAVNLAGEGIFEKQNTTTTITIDHANTGFTGTTLIMGGTLALTDLLGTGTGAVINDASLDLAGSGTYANHISGSGVTYLTNHAAVAITGSNETIWEITAGASGTVTEQQNLGAGSTNVEGTLAIVSSSAWTYSNTLTGSGTLSVNLGSSTHAFDFGSTSGTAFNGTAVLASSSFALSGNNTAALTDATLEISDGNITTVGTGTQSIGNLTLSSGTIAFTLATGTSADGIVKTNTLTLRDTVLQVDTTNLSNEQGLPLLQQDEGTVIQLVDSTAIGAGSTKTQITGTNLVDQNGVQIGNATQRDIVQNSDITASGTYDFAANVTGSGMYLSYTLTGLDLIAGKTTILDNDIDNAVLHGADELHATVSGSGNLAINANSSITLNNGDNNYTGATYVRSGTLIAGADHVLGDTSLLALDAATVFDLNDHAQTIGSINTAAGSTVQLGTSGSLAILNGGTSFGVLTGGSAATLAIDGGTLTVHGVSPGYQGHTDIASAATVIITNAGAFGADSSSNGGRISIAQGGTLHLDIVADAIFKNSFSGSGALIKSGTALVVIKNANNGFVGTATVQSGTLQATDIAAVGTAAVTIGANAAFEYNQITSGTSQNTFSGSGALNITNSALTLALDNSMAYANLDGADVTMASNNALGTLATVVTMSSTTSAIRIATPAAQLGTLNMNGGAFVFEKPANFGTAPGSAYNRAHIETLGASTGAFVFNVDFTGASGAMTAATGMKANSLEIRNDQANTTPHAVIIDYTGAPDSSAPAASFELITTGNGSATFEMANSGGKIDFGASAYTFIRGDGQDLTRNSNNWYLADTGFSGAADVIIDTASTIPLDWNIAMDALYLRMGDVRAENFANLSNRDTNDGNGTQSNGHLTGNVWIRSRGYRLNATNSVTDLDFDQYGWGVTAGADKAFEIKGGVNLLGGFVDMGGVSRDMHSRGSSDTHNVGAGLYLTLLREAGWFADVVGRVDRYSNNIEGKTPNRESVNADYRNYSYGASIEAGRRLQRRDGWWVEPTLQVAAHWLSSSDYDTRPPAQVIHVSVDDTFTMQYRALVRFGRQIGNSKWHPYGKFAAVAVDTDGGTLQTNNKFANPTFDGKRLEFGFGTTYRIDDLSQWYLDYEYAKSNYYERPWTLNLGYRRLW